MGMRPENRTLLSLFVGEEPSPDGKPHMVFLSRVELPQVRFAAGPPDPQAGTFLVRAPGIEPGTAGLEGWPAIIAARV